VSAGTSRKGGQHQADEVLERVLGSTTICTSTSR
jgi:hypothetical protein